MNFIKKLIVLSYPDFFPGEVTIVRRLFDAGLETFHLRKPEADSGRIRSFLEQLPAACRNKIVLHDALELADGFGVRGVHLNRRHPEAPDGWTGSRSRSCHALEEVSQSAGFDYVFLSPVFDSISKAGYESVFSEETLRKATASGLLTPRVIALGGIDGTTLPRLAPFGFGGAAVLGAVWGNRPQADDADAVLERYDRLIHILTDMPS